MAEYEKDFILRQHKDLAKALSVFLEDSSVDDILQMDQESGQKYQSETLKNTSSTPAENNLDKK